MRIEIGENSFEVSFKRIINITIGLAIFFALFSAFYTIDTNENGVVLRFGKYSTTTSSGLHFKLPFGIDKVYKIKVDYQYKEEFGFRTSKPGVRSEYVSGHHEDEAWMLTGDLNIANVLWVVQYKIKDPVQFLFEVRDVPNTLRDVSEAVMRLMIGDRSFQEVLQAERVAISIAARDLMQEVMDKYETGVVIQIVQLQDVLPPAPVASSFNEVNSAKQEQEASINEARQAYNKEIYRVEGDAKRVVAEAAGYAIERVNNAKGDAALFNSIYKEYAKSPQVTKDRMYIETMEKVMSNIEGKVIVNKQLKNVLPLLNIGQDKTSDK